MNNNDVNQNTGTNMNSNTQNNIINTGVTGEINIPSSASQPVSNNDSGTITNSVNTDPGAVVNENLKKVEINYKPPSKFKIFLLVFFFIFLIAFVLFLPDITTYINKYKAGNLNAEEEKILTGQLKCFLNTSTASLDKNYDVTFSYSNNKLEKVKYIITTKGDVDLDATELDSLNAICKNLEKDVEGIKGINVSCEYKTGKLVERQSFELKELNMEDINSAFAESGGNIPNYQFGQDMDRIESNMNASNYICERTY